MTFRKRTVVGRRSEDLPRRRDIANRPTGRCVPCERLTVCRGIAPPPTGRPARPALIGALLALGLLVGTPGAAANGVVEAWQGTSWGETGDDLLRQFGARATRLARPLDFGDSYVDVVLRGQMIGGYPFLVFFQLDKATHGLKRIQLERPRHGVNPAAFRAVLAEIEAAYGDPDRVCETRPRPASGYQRATGLTWRRDGAVIRAIFRDTTIEATEGCGLGVCGLTGQLLVRISPAAADPGTCG